MKQRKISIGQVFGKLTVTKKAPNVIGKNREYGAWECSCECGNTKIIATYHLNRGAVSSCGCLYDEHGKSLKPGQKINRLTTVSYKDGIWLCSCECGEIVAVSTDRLNSGNTKSCGCLKTDISRANASKLIEGRRKNEPRIASARRVWQQYCYRDKNCTITIDEFLIISQQPCFYCGIQPNTKYNYFSTASSNSSEKAKAEGLFIYNGMDRVDSLLSHTMDNVVPCCYDCNRAKCDRSVADFLSWISQLKITDFQPITT